MPDAKELLYINLHEVFAERDPDARRAAIERAYDEDVRFIDPEGEVVGREAVNNSAQKLLDGGSKHERISAIVDARGRGSVYERDWVSISYRNGLVR